MSHHTPKGAYPVNNYEAVKKHREKLVEFKVRPYREEAQQIREAADRLGMSVQGLFLEAVREYIKNHEDRPE